ncbi:hypothetical protein GCM10027447_00330 [Glycomyces halotolerans]
MTKAGTALAALLAASALTASCTDEAPPPDAALESATDDRMFGPAPDFEAHTAQLLTASSDKDIAALCADLGGELAAGFVVHEDATDPASDAWCGFAVDDIEPTEAPERSTSGEGAALPVRVHAWSDADGSHVSFFDPVPFLSAIDGDDPALAERGETLLAGLTAAVAEATGGTAEAGDPTDVTYTEIPSEIPAPELTEALERTAAEAGLRLIDRIAYEAAGTTLVFAVEGEDSAYYADLYEASPAIGVANPVQFHVWSDASGNGVIGYFDPMPLFRAVGPEFEDAGIELSTLLSNAAWDAAAPV